MWLKRALITAPIAFVILLLQSYFWVPTYEAQTTGNPARLTKYIEASIGDAKLLNPIVNADSASSRISGLVFDGLLELGPDLTLAPRLAKSWQLSETAYLVIDTTSTLPDGSPVSAQALHTQIRKHLESGTLANLTGTELVPASIVTTSITRPSADGDPVTLDVIVNVPARIKLSLSQVQQDLFDQLAPILGSTYGTRFDARKLISSKTGELELSEADLDVLLPLIEHNPVIEFELRDDVLFHDGHPFDARDVAFTYEAIMNRRNLSPRTSDFEPIKTLEVLDEHRVRVTYKRLFSPAIAAWTIGILPEHLLNRERLNLEVQALQLSDTARESFGLRDTSFNRKPIGTGPYYFAEWQGDEYIHLKRFERHWQGAPQFHDYYYRVIPDVLTQEMEFRTGAIDRYGPQPHQVDRFRESERYQTFSNPGFNYSYIGYNNRRAPFDDARVRRALGMALNVDEIIEYVLYGEADQISGPYPRNTRWYDQTVTQLPYDPEAASKLLAQAGWSRNAQGWLEKDGKVLEFNLITNNGNQIRKAIMTIAQDNWRKIGVKCNTQLFEWAVFLEDFINPAQFDAVILGWSMSIDPDLFQLWHSTQSGFGQLNFVGYQSAQADDLIVRIREEYDSDAQQSLAHALHRQIARDQPYTFLFSQLSTQVLDKKIVMVDDNNETVPLEVPLSGDPFYYFTRWRKLELSPAF